MTASRAVEAWRKECKRLAGEAGVIICAQAWYSPRAMAWRLWVHRPGGIHVGRHAVPCELRQSKPGFAEALAAEMVKEAREGRE